MGTFTIFEEAVKQVPLAVLNIGAGKGYPLFKDKLPQGSIIVNLDSGYLNSSNIKDIISRHEKLIDDPEELKFTTKKMNIRHQGNYPSVRVYYLKHNISRFLLNYYYKFDIICMYNFLEKVPRGKEYNFFNLVYNSLKYNGYMDIVYNDFNKVSKYLINYENNNRKDLIDKYCLYERLFGDGNVRYKSIWTPNKVEHMFKDFNMQVIKYASDNNFNTRRVGIKLGKTNPNEVGFFDKKEE